MEPLNDYTPEILLADARFSKGPVRYNAVERPLGLLRSIGLYLRYGQWARVERTFEPVFPGEPGYEEAVYESALLWERIAPDEKGKQP